MAKDLTTHKPSIPTAYGEQLLRKRRAIRVRQAQRVDLQLHFRDADGKVCDFSDLTFVGDSGSSKSSSSVSASGEAHTVQARFREGTETDSEIYVVDAEMVDPEQGLAQCRVPQSQVADVSGVWLAEIGILDSDKCLLATTDCYIYVEKSGWSSASELGPPQIQTVRQSLADDDPLLNELLDNTEFDDGDIAYAAIRAVQDWRDTPPPVSRANYNTTNFPFRDIWLLGIQVYLLRRADMHYRRNFYPYDAGGMRRDDKNRFREYTEAIQQRLAEFRRLMIHRKVVINAQGGFSSNLSGYHYTYNTSID